ncbi:ParA family protein [Hoyosella sp. G463]|uniref:ParA family protein n=1 Tax=Lolliginicoccus lacisalsi TaxID=2742202 RepID=A0A927JDB9_9ACTN|nr:ParA family protein [Lolliginicoccus lacisalsi]MBD8507028.1 ParA family protein [Lolliginicoccus lacisalsi]
MSDDLRTSVSRETSRETTPKSVADAEMDGLIEGILADSPIAAAAQRATSFHHRTGDPLPRPPQPRVFTVANQKGGVGKTTTTVNLAVALAVHGLNVLVIDLDPQGNASTALGAEHGSGTPSSYELILGDIEPAEAIQRATASENLHVVPATIDLAGAEIELVMLEGREHKLKQVLSSPQIQRRGFDYIFIDCPPSLGLLTLNAMVAATEVLIPIQCEYYALEGVGQLLNNIELVRAHLNPRLSISTILLTMYDARTKLAEQVANEVRGHFGEVVLRTVIPRSVKVSEAPGYGMSVIEYDAGSRGAMSYLDAGREIANRVRDTVRSSRG